MDRQKLRYRSWHRGTREMDLLMGSFADEQIPNFTQEQLTQYDAILQISDPDLYNWITGTEKVPEENDSEVMRMLCQHRFANKEI